MESGLSSLLTHGNACRAHQRPLACDKLHFKRLIFSWTDPSLGNCSYLDTCRHMKGCKYIHYELDDEVPALGKFLSYLVLLARQIIEQHCLPVDNQCSSCKPVSA